MTTYEVLMKALDFEIDIVGWIFVLVLPIMIVLGILVVYELVCYMFGEDTYD